MVTDDRQTQNDNLTIVHAPRVNENVTYIILSVCLNSISASKSLGGVSLRAMLGQVTLIIPTKGTLEINKCMYSLAVCTAIILYRPCLGFLSEPHICHQIPWQHLSGTHALRAAPGDPIRGHSVGIHEQKGSGIFSIGQNGESPL